MRTKPLSFLTMLTLAATLAVVDPTLAHGRDYYATWETPVEPHLGFGFVVPMVCPLNDQDIYVGVVCYEAGHIVPDFWGLASVTITDTVQPQASLGACQDDDLDGVCGEISLDETEYREGGCGTLFMETREGWNPEFPLYVMADGPVTGNSVFGMCEDISFATFGTISHS